VVDELYAIARDPTVIVSNPYVFQAWGTLAGWEGARPRWSRKARQRLSRDPV